MWNLGKNGTDEPISEAGIETKIENRHVEMRWGEGEGRMNWEIWTDMCKIDSGNLL